MKKNNQKMSVQEAGRKGGETTSQEHGPQFYHEIGRKGGETTRKKHGSGFYHDIGQKGGDRVRSLINKGKKSEK